MFHVKQAPLTVTDHSVSGEHFRLVYDAALHMYRTDPKPKEEELGAYYKSENYISHTDGRRSLFERVYQGVKRIALSRKHRLIKRLHSQAGTLLDIGAGTGDFAVYMTKRGWDVQAIEPNDNARALAKAKGAVCHERLVEKGSFDVITLWHVLEHVYDLELYFRYLRKHLCENGTLLIAVPNFESWDAGHYGAFWAAYDVPRHLYHFSKKSMAALAAQFNLRVIDIVPMKFDAYYVSLLSEKYATGRMNYWKAFRAGYLSNRSARQENNYSSLVYVLKHK